MLGRRHFRVCVCSIPASAIPAIPALFITQEDLSVVSITPRLTVLLPQSEAFAPAAQSGFLSTGEMNLESLDATFASTRCSCSSISALGISRKPELLSTYEDARWPSRPAKRPQPHGLAASVHCFVRRALYASLGTTVCCKPPPGKHRQCAGGCKAESEAMRTTFPVRRSLLRSSFWIYWAIGNTQWSG
jgi:hypothetical protein